MDDERNAADPQRDAPGAGEEPTLSPGRSLALMATVVAL
jgi:hypothetical protein